MISQIADACSQGVSWPEAVKDGIIALAAAGAIWAFFWGISR